MKYIVKIRYGDPKFLEDFLTKEPHLPKGTLCVIHTERGTEIGTVVVPPKKRKPDQQTSPERFVIRVATEEDLKHIQNLEEAEKEEFAFAKERIKARGLPMKLSKVDHLFGGEKIIFYFLSATRVDFRALVRDLAKRYKTRIEMRQIGARDEAKLLGDVGHCGQELCCVRFLKEFKPVTMKMAKNQKASLDQRKISGLCGKLLCCLQYENDLYTEALSKMPPVGSIVETQEGTGEVLSIDPLRELLTVKIPDRGKLEIKLSQVIQKITNDELKKERKSPQEVKKPKSYNR